MVGRKEIEITPIEVVHDPTVKRGMFDTVRRGSQTAV